MDPDLRRHTDEIIVLICVYLFESVANSSREVPVPHGRTCDPDALHSVLDIVNYFLTDRIHRSLLNAIINSADLDSDSKRYCVSGLQFKRNAALAEQFGAG